MNDLIINKIEETKQLQNHIETNKLDYTIRNYDFSKYSLLVVFSRDIHEGIWSIEDVDEE